MAVSIADNIDVMNVYWMRGSAPKGSATHALGFEVKDPPVLGWARTLAIKSTGRSKLLTLFCPFSFESFQVRANSGEVLSSRRRPIEPGEFDVQWLIDHLKKKWAEFQGFGYMKDYDTAALVFRALGQPVPEQILKGGEEDTRMKGGKEVRSALTKPVKAKSKRGLFLRWFMEGNGSRPVREAMATFGMTRSNALSYLFMLQKDHGIGYKLIGDVASIDMPPCDSPFDDGSTVDGFSTEDAPKESKPSASALEEPSTEDEDDSWLD